MSCYPTAGPPLGPEPFSLTFYSIQRLFAIGVHVMLTYRPQESIALSERRVIRPQLHETMFADELQSLLRPSNRGA